MAATSQCLASFRFPVKGFMKEGVIWTGDLLGTRFADSKDSPFREDLFEDLKERGFKLTFRPPLPDKT